LDEAEFEEALEGWVEGAMAYLEDLFGSLLDGAGDRVAVEAAEGEGLKDQKIQSALK
jgi:hypothetical protein